MKKTVILLSAALLLLFASCQKEYGYYSTSRFRIYLDTQAALANLVEVNAGDFLLDDSHRLRVQHFIYDAETGLLFDHIVDYAEQYESLSFRVDDMPLGQYVLITATDVVNADNCQSDYWEYLGTDRLVTFKVYGLDNMDFWGERMLTLTQHRFEINGRRKSLSVSIDAEPVTALICVNYFDIFYWDSNTVAKEKANRYYTYFDVAYPDDYNTVSWKDTRADHPWIYSQTGPVEDAYVLDFIRPDEYADKDISNLYGYHAVLPGEYSFTGYGEYTIGNGKERYPDTTRPTSSLFVSEGMQYYVDFDIKNWSVTFEAETSSQPLSAPMARQALQPVSRSAAPALVPRTRTDAQR